MNKTSIFVTICLAALLSACSAPVIQYTDMFLEHKDVCFVVGQKELIDFSAGPVQTEYSPSTHLLRSGVCSVTQDINTGLYAEVMREYYTVKLESNPTEEGEVINASVALRTTDLDRTYDATFTVLKINSEYVWLYDDALKLGIVGRIGGKSL